MTRCPSDVNMTARARLIAAAMRGANRRALHFDPDTGGPPQPEEGRRYVLYLHIPFCESLCPFCSFHRLQFKAAQARPYFAALRSEILRYAELGFQFGEVYVGGGTPTVMPEELAATLHLVRERFRVRDISVETNPNHLQQPIVERLQAAGVTRLSVGVQTFDDRLLKRMGRYQAYGSGRRTAERLAEFGQAFRTVNVDLIFNLPDQSRASFARDLEIVGSERLATQVSFYPLMATPDVRARMRREMGVASRDNEFEFYRLISAGLGPEYVADSAWCFSKGTGMVDEYVVDHDDYVGVGSGAFGYLHGRLMANTFSLRQYQARVSAGGFGITHSRDFSRREQLRYHLLMRLFGLQLDKAVTRQRFGEDALRALWPELLALRLIGAVRDTGDQLQLTDRGKYYWVVLMREFFTGISRFREAMRKQWKTASSSTMSRQTGLEV